MTTQSPRTAVGRRLAALALVALVGAATASEALAQRVTPPGGRRTVAYVSPDELVSFPAATPFDDFVRLVNPVFLRVTGKAVVDPMDRTEEIGVALNGIHFIDAFELVLARAGLDFRESEHYFIIQDASAQAVGSDVLNADAGVAAQAAGLPVGATLPATADTREVRIDAIIFEANLNRFREAGTNWAALFGEAGGAGQGGTGGGTGGGQGGQGGTEIPRFYVEAESFFDALDGFLTVSSDRIDLAFLLRLFRWFESEGYGETIASPSVTVQSGEQGRMQSGSDIPIQIQDFQGNTITQFVSTGVIIDVTPTLISDPGEGGAPMEFVHLDVKVEKSTGRPLASGIQIDKNDVNTQVLLLDGEQTVIGGLYSTEETVFRKGIPILKDIPLLKYLFSYRSRNVLQKELVVVLQARVVDPIPLRAGRPLPQDLLQQEREDFRDRLDRFRPGAGTSYDEVQTNMDREIGRGNYDLPNEGQ